MSCLYFAQNYPEMAWAVFMAGGSLPSLPSIDDPSFLEDALKMDVVENKGEGYYKLEDPDIGAIIYCMDENNLTSIDMKSGLYQLTYIDKLTGKVKKANDINIKNDKLELSKIDPNFIIWLKYIGQKFEI
jgi:hypothetical protein